MSYTPLLGIFQPKLLIFGFARLPRAKTGVLAGLVGLAMGWAGFINGAAAKDGNVEFTAMPAPSMITEILDQQGAVTTIDAFKGRPVLINFWATWCAPCVAELPALERAAAVLADDDMPVIVISIDRGGQAKAGPFLDEHDVHTPHRLFDPKARLSREMGVRGLPSSFILSADQETSWMFVGPIEWDESELLTAIASLPLRD